MNVTPELLELAYGAQRRGVKYDVWAALLTEVGLVYQMDTAKRMAAFLAQLGHESGRLVHMRELWGPTPAQRRYEPPSDKATELGNTQPGDGRRFSGHGPIQITGRGNHARMRDRLRARFPELRVPDFEKEPLALTVPMWGCYAAGEFWDSRGLNALADIGNQLAICKRVNGGRNGYAERVSLYSSALGACLLCGW